MIKCEILSAEEFEHLRTILLAKTHYNPKRCAAETLMISERFISTCSVKTLEEDLDLLLFSSIMAKVGPLSKSPTLH